MNGLWIAAAVFLLGGVGSDEASGPVWSVRSYLGESAQLCDATALELILRSNDGDAQAPHRVSFDDAGVHDEIMSTRSGLGTVIVEVLRVDCAGVRAKVATLPTTVTTTTRLKRVYIAALAHDGAVDPRFVEVDTYVDTDAVSARREGSTLVLTNHGPSAIQLCGNSSVVSIRDEVLTDEQWESGSVSWDIPPDVLTIEPGSELRVRPGVVKKYFPPNSKPKTPEAARVLVAIKPETPSHIVLGDIPLGFVGFPGCDFVYVSRAVTKADRIWIHDGEMP